MGKSWEMPARPDSAKPDNPENETREKHLHEDGVYNIDHRKIDEKFRESVARLKASPLLIGADPIVAMYARLAVDFGEDPYTMFIEYVAEYMGMSKDALLKKEGELPRKENK